MGCSHHKKVIILRIEKYPSKNNLCKQLLSSTEVLASESHRDFEEASDAIHQGFNQFKQFIRETWPRYAIHQQPNRGWCVRPVSEICNALAQTKYHQWNTSPFYNKIETMKTHFSWLTKGDLFGNLFCNPCHFPPFFLTKLSTKTCSVSRFGLSARSKHHINVLQRIQNEFVSNLLRPTSVWEIFWFFRMVLPEKTCMPSGQFVSIFHILTMWKW